MPQRACGCRVYSRARTPWISEWDPAAYEAKHRMAPEVAEQIKKIATY